MTEDTITESPFFALLKERAPLAVEKLRRHSLCVGIPTGSSFQVKDLGPHFDFESYVLIPSKHEKHLFVTMNRKTLRLSRGDDQGLFLQTLQDFKDSRKIAVLAEETCYDADLRPYTVFWLSGLLEGHATPQSRNAIDVLFEVERKFAQENEALLRTFPGNEKFLQEADIKVAKFCGNYALVKGYLDDAHAKLKNIIDELQTDILSSNAEVAALCRRDHNADVFATAVASYVGVRAHPRIMVALTSMYHKEDQELCQRLESLQPSDDQALLSAADHLKELPECTEANEMMFAVAAAFKCLTTTSKTNVITTDDLIPLFGHALALATLAHPFSLMTYLAYFLFSNGLQAGQQWGYFQTTMQAAVQYVYNFGDMGTDRCLDNPDTLVSLPGISKT